MAAGHLHIGQDNAIYYTAPNVRHTPPIGPGLPRLYCHDVELSLQLPCTQHGQVLDEIRGIRVHLQNISERYRKLAMFTTPVSQKRHLRHIYDTAPRSRRTLRIGQTLPRLCWHVVGLSLKLSCTLNDPVLDEEHRIRVRPSIFRPVW